MNFASDNVFGVHPRILEALQAANAGTATSYGADDWTKRAEQRLGEVFEREVSAYLVVTGTAANALALSTMVPPYGALLCHADSHIMVDECGAPELFTGGAKLIGLDEPYGKITAGAVERKLDGFIRGVHDARPAAISITQASEAGTVYTRPEIEAISEVARRRALRLHMDGARFANALVSLAATPAELTWKAGVEALSFGATKNGAMALEAVVFFDIALAEDFGHRRMRAGQLLSKGRFLGAQMLAYLDDDLWLEYDLWATAQSGALTTTTTYDSLCPLALKFRIMKSRTVRLYSWGSGNEGTGRRWGRLRGFACRILADSWHWRCATAKHVSQ